MKKQGKITLIIFALGILLIGGGLLFPKNKTDDESVIRYDVVRTVKPGQWAATDAIGRTLTTSNNKESKYRAVGMFYWPWHYSNNVNSKGPYNVNNIIADNPSRIHDTSWWQNNYAAGAYWWNEPIYGYYQELDDYVLRKQVELLADAKIDFVVFDCTNGSITWKEAYENILKVWKEAKNQGVNVPKIAFMTNFTYSAGGDSAIQQLLTNLYDENSQNYKNYSDMLYKYNGKFLILVDASGMKETTEGTTLLNELSTRFEVRDPVGSYFEGLDGEWKENGEWGWLSVNPQAVYKKAVDTTRAEQVTVGVAQNASSTSNKLTAMNGNNVMGRSFAKDNYSYSYQSKGSTITVGDKISKNGTVTDTNTSLYGRNFQQQWDYAISIDPEIIFVTGWNEWIMGREASWPDASGGETVTNAFPDEFNDEYSRDIEPSKGALKDNYYYQLVENIRRYKGVGTQASQLTPVTINMSNEEDWKNDNINTYYHYIGGKNRSARGWGASLNASNAYQNTSFRNDISLAKVSYDNTYIYFYVETASALTGDLNDKFMRLLIDTKDNVSDSNYDNWEGFEYIVNKTVNNNTPNTVKIEKFTGDGFTTTEVGEALYSIKDKVFQVAIPRVYLGLTAEDINFRFKWADNNLDNGDIMTLYTDGDSAPGGRFTFSFTGKATSNSVIPVINISLNKSATTVYVGGNETLQATVTPSDATNRGINWTSDDESIALVSERGTVFGIKAGTTTIRATTKDGNKVASCTVTVRNVAVTKVTLDKETLSIEKGKTDTLTATVSPNNATDKTVTWSSSDESIATVSSMGEVTGKKTGTATITVTTKDGNKTATCTVTVKNPTISVTGVSINKTLTEIEVGAKETLSATVAPSNATNKNVTWSSNDESIATVSSTGEVTGKKAGTATITVTTKDGNKTATCTVTVKNPIVPVTGISLNKTQTSIILGEKETLIATVKPDNASNKDVIWSSSNSSIATVSSNGTVTAVKAGTATITATTKDGNKVASCDVTVLVPVTGVSLNKDKLNIAVGGKESLIATIAPSNATNKNIEWSSSNSSIATISSTGEVTGIKAGTATITVTTEDGNKTATCLVTVVKPVTGVNLNKTEAEIEVGAKETLIASIVPIDASNKEVTWSSSDLDIATVSSTGEVTGVKAGTATITVTTKDGNKTASCLVTVKNPIIYVTGISLDKTTTSLEVGGKKTLIATITPSNATTKNVTWSSSDTSIVTVNSNGEITGIKAGTAAITVTTKDGNKTATCQVTVVNASIPVTGVSLNKTSISLNIGMKEVLRAIITPNNATNDSVIWSSSDNSVATVSQTGEVTGIKEGTTTITVTTQDGNKTARCEVTVIDPTIYVTGITLDKTKLSLDEGTTATLIANVTPSNATNKLVTWKSSNDEVATISENGLVTAVKEGSAVITVTTKDGNKTASCEVTVTKERVDPEPDPEPTNNNLLKTLSINGENISIDKDTRVINYTVEYEITSVVIDSTLIDENASFAPGYGPRKVSLKVGKNEALLKVIAKDKEVTYEINITRKEATEVLDNIPNTGQTGGLIAYIIIVVTGLISIMIYKKENIFKNKSGAE